MKCLVCDKDIGTFFDHLAQCNDELHNSFINEIVNIVLVEAKNHFSFEITEIVYDKYPDIPLSEFGILTFFISKVIKLSGFSPRKRVGKERAKIDYPYIYDDIRNALFYSLPYSIRKKYDSFEKTPCVYCGEDWDSFKSIDGTITTYVPSNNVSVCSVCRQRRHINKVAITKIFYFAAAHHLPFHQRLCQFTHGHEWKLEVTIKDYVDPDTQMVIDFSDLKKAVKENIIDVLDHNYLNDIIWNPTAENICYWIWDELMKVGLIGIEKIKLWEAPESFAELSLHEFSNMGI